MKRIILTAVALMAASPAAAVTTTTLGAAGDFANAPTSLYSSVNYFNTFEAPTDNARFSPGVVLSNAPTPKVSAQPANDTTQYAIVNTFNNNSPNVFSTAGLVFNQVSFYWGSMDDFNRLSFINSAGNSVDGQVYTGTTFNGSSADDGQISRYVTFTFDAATAAQITGIRFESANFNNSFEFDNLILGTAVPEPSTWAMMMVGLGLVGGALRRRAKATVKGLAAA